MDIPPGHSKEVRVALQNAVHDCMGVPLNGKSAQIFGQSSNEMLAEYIIEAPKMASNGYSLNIGWRIIKQMVK